MVSLMGPPPKQFLDRSDQCRKYWDAEGEVSHSYCLLFDRLIIEANWIADTPIPKQTLETREMRLKGKDKDLLLGLLRKILQWLPEERPSAEELYKDDFIYQFMSEH